MSKLTPEKKCILILSIFSLAALVIFIPVSAVFNLWGLTLGWSIGCFATIINMILLFRSGDVVMEAAKSESGLGLSVLFYIVRFLIIAGSLILCAVLHFIVKNETFYYSLFTCAASVLPSSLIIVIFYRNEDKSEKK